MGNRVASGQLGTPGHLGVSSGPHHPPTYDRPLTLTLICDHYPMLVAFSVTPLGVGESVGDLVAEAVRVVRASGLPNRTDAMFTTIEGEWDECFAVVKQAVEAVAKGAPRVSVSLKADVRPGVSGALTAKVEHIEQALRE